MGRALSFIRGKGRTSSREYIWMNKERQKQAASWFHCVKLFSQWLAAFFFFFLLCKCTKNIIISTDWVIHKVWKKIAQLYKVKKKNVIIFFSILFKTPEANANLLE